MDSFKEKELARRVLFNWQMEQLGGVPRDNKPLPGRSRQIRMLLERGRSKRKEMKQQNM